MPERDNRNEQQFGRVLEMLDRGKQDRKEILDRLNSIDEHLNILNSRTDKLENRSDLFDDTVERVGDMAETVQFVKSTVATVKNWGWRLAVVFGLTLVVGNQAATRIFDLVLKWMTGPATPQ